MRATADQVFLEWWANLKMDSVQTFLPQVLRRLPTKVSEEEPVVLQPEYLSIANDIRAFWREQNKDRKFYLGYRLIEWAVSHSRRLLQFRAARQPYYPNVIFSGLQLEKETRPYALEQPFAYLLKRAKRTGFCRNPDCAAPYFFRDKPRQRYCSDTCAKKAIRESKRAYWHKEGKFVRKARRHKIGRATNTTAHEKRIARNIAPKQATKERKNK